MTPPDSRTVFLPEDWPVRIHSDDWPLVGSGQADSNSGRAGRWDRRGADPAQQPQPDHYQIDVYCWDDRYIIAGTHSTASQRVIRNTGRRVTGRSGVVPAIRAVARELNVDAAVRLVLVQDVLGSLDPEELR